MKSFMHYLNDGGVYIMYPIIVLLIVVIVIFVKSFFDKKPIRHTRSLLTSIGWFAVAWGYLGRTVGLIGAFDNIAASGDISPSMLSGGLKMALLGPLAGIIVFLIARAFIITLIMKEKNSVSD